MTTVQESIAQYGFYEARYPTGISSFEEIRRRGMVYVDKTALLFRMAVTGSYYFLSRPRRFGKSLMLSTLKSYFQGRKEFFENLAIAEMEREWRFHPVIHFSMGGKDFTDRKALEEHLHAVIDFAEQDLDLAASAKSVEERFMLLIRNSYRKYGERVVVLIDEYDKPLLDTRDKNNTTHREVNELLRGFYGCLKDSNDYLRFVMLAGITKFSHVNIFSGLNNLTDISLDPKYNAVCGISESEMAEYFGGDMERFAAKQGGSVADVARQFKINYDGYHFASEGENIYNPYSVLNAFRAMQFGSYWYQSGTSMYLVREMSRSNYDFRSLDRVSIGRESLMGTSMNENNIVALLYQSGYLTIKGYDAASDTFELGFPNKEVSSGFFNNLLETFISREQYMSNFSASLVRRKANTGDAEGLMQLLKTGLSRYNYEQLDAPSTEKHFVLMLFALSQAIGLNCESEVKTYRGRIDFVILCERYVYIIEFKVNSYPKRALDQINKLDYAGKYYGDSRKIIKIGANFSTKNRTITGWVIEEN